MKKIIFTLALGMLISLAFPQSYHKLVRTNVYWDDFYVVLPELCFTGGSRVYFTNQDTVINGLTYKISKSQQIHQANPGPFCPPFLLDTIAYTTPQFFREDTLARKVYLYSPDNGGSDQLFYDFSLQVGDTLKSGYYLAIGDTLVLDSIGDLVLDNGESRKAFWFNSNLHAYYIESIGSPEGLFYPLQVGFTESYGGIFCMKENSVSLFGIMCGSLYVGQKDMQHKAVSVYPNPADSFITIDIPGPCERSEFRLVNVQGQEVFNHKLAPGSNSFSISDIIPGIYFYQVKSNQEIHNGKLTKY